MFKLFVLLCFDFYYKYTINILFHINCHEYCLINLEPYINTCVIIHNISVASDDNIDPIMIIITPLLLFAVSVILVHHLF